MPILTFDFDCPNSDTGCQGVVMFVDERSLICNECGCKINVLPAAEPELILDADNNAIESMTKVVIEIRTPYLIGLVGSGSTSDERISIDVRKREPETIVVQQAKRKRDLERLAALYGVPFKRRYWIPIWYSVDRVRKTLNEHVKEFSDSLRVGVPIAPAGYRYIDNELKPTGPPIDRRIRTDDGDVVEWGDPNLEGSWRKKKKMLTAKEFAAKKKNTEV